MPFSNNEFLLTIKGFYLIRIQREERSKTIRPFFSFDEYYVYFLEKGYETNELNFIKKN
jgi:hypothetical protein